MSCGDSRPGRSGWLIQYSTAMSSSKVTTSDWRIMSFQTRMVLPCACTISFARFWKSANRSANVASGPNFCCAYSVSWGWFSPVPGQLGNSSEPKCHTSEENWSMVSSMMLSAHSTASSLVRSRACGSRVPSWLRSWYSGCEGSTVAMCPGMFSWGTTCT